MHPALPVAAVMPSPPVSAQATAFMFQIKKLNWPLRWSGCYISREVGSPATQKGTVRRYLKRLLFCSAPTGLQLGEGCQRRPVQPLFFPNLATSTGVETSNKRSGMS